jgi:hypothetical protein
MKIGINLVGVSYNDGKVGRYRNYKDAIDSLYENVVNPLKEKGHEIYFYIFSYDSEKAENMLSDYQPIKKVKLLESYYKTYEGNYKVNSEIKIMSAMYLHSLEALLDEDLDVVISTRFDINFFRNPFKEYQYDFTKCNFLWREPEFEHLPIVNDTFIVFPHSMTKNLINAIFELELNPPHGVNVGLHNIYLPMVNQVGKENVQWLDDEFKTIQTNTLYKVTRKE